jgi:hypothetical protein
VTNLHWWCIIGLDSVVKISMKCATCSVSASEAVMSGRFQMQSLKVSFSVQSLRTDQDANYVLNQPSVSGLSLICAFDGL